MNSTNKITKSFLLMHIYLITMIASALLLLVTRQTHATIITVEPDDFPRFHDLTNVDPHVTFSVAKTTGELTSTDLNKVVVIEGTAPSTGSFVFGRQIAAYFPDQYWFQSGLDFVPAVLRADFSTPTDFISIDIIDIGSAHVGQLQAFSASGNLLETFTANLSGTGTFMTASIARSTADIAYILVAGFPPGGPPFNAVALDHLQFSLNVPPEISVTIDIKPNTDPNSINPISKGVIPVAILSTDTFDATTVDSSSIRFGVTGIEAVPSHYALEDVDGDGDIDMIIHFSTQSTDIKCGDSSASLTGKTADGQDIVGTDSISTVGCKW